MEVGKGRQPNMVRRGDDGASLRALNAARRVMNAFAGFLDVTSCARGRVA